jgi:hypothetical protein
LLMSMLMLSMSMSMLSMSMSMLSMSMSMLSMSLLVNENDKLKYYDDSESSRQLNLSMCCHDMFIMFYFLWPMMVFKYVGNDFNVNEKRKTKPTNKLQKHAEFRVPSNLTVYDLDGNIYPASVGYGIIISTIQEFQRHTNFSARIICEGLFCHLWLVW